MLSFKSIVLTRRLFFLRRHAIATYRGSYKLIGAKMKYFLLPLPKQGASAHHKAVVKGLKSAISPDVKVFRTFISVDAGEKEVSNFIFVTTSKEAHLDFGRIETQSVLAHLCLLLEEMFKAAGQAEILLSKSEQGSQKACLITRTQSSSTVTFNWSPAY